MIKYCINFFSRKVLKSEKLLKYTDALLSIVIFQMLTFNIGNPDHQVWRIVLNYFWHWIFAFLQISAVDSLDQILIEVNYNFYKHLISANWCLVRHFHFQQREKSFDVNKFYLPVRVIQKNMGLKRMPIQKP